MDIKGNDMICESRKAKPGGIEQLSEPVRRTGLYLRLSDREESGGAVHSNSIENQKSYLLNYLRDKPFLQVKEIYIDDGKTGTNFQRNGFLKLLSDIKAGEINCVIVKDLSRLGRNFYETGALLETVFPFYGVRFISVSEGFDSEKAGFEDLSFNIPITNFINETYAIDVSKKIRSARVSMAKRGKVPYSNIAYGYKKLDGDKYSLKIDKEAAEIIRLIFNWFEGGMGKTAIARELNKKGILSPSQYKRQKGGNTPYPENSIWTDNTIRSILNNPVYSAMAVFGRTKPIKPRGKNVPVPKGNWILNENTYPEIITKEQFQRVQELQNKRRKNFSKGNHFKRESYEDNILKGIIYCEECERRLKRKRAKRKNRDIYYFECCNYINGGECSKKYINEEKIYDALYQCVKKYIQLSEKKDTQQMNSIPDNIKKEIKALNVEINKTALGLSRIYKGYHSGSLDKQTFISLKEKCRNEKKKYMIDKETLEKHAGEYNHRNENLEFDWENKMGLLNEFLHIVVEKIEVCGEKKITVILNFGDLFQMLKN